MSFKRVIICVHFNLVSQITKVDIDVKVRADKGDLDHTSIDQTIGLYKVALRYENFCSSEWSFSI